MMPISFVMITAIRLDCFSLFYILIIFLYIVYFTYTNIKPENMCKYIFVTVITMVAGVQPTFFTKKDLVSFCHIFFSDISAVHHQTCEIRAKVFGKIRVGM